MRNLFKDAAKFRTFGALIVGIALGALAIETSRNVGAQAPLYPDSNQESIDLRQAYEAEAAPTVAPAGAGKARFSRPLEVPPLYAFDSPLESGGRQIVLVDSTTKRICVYWVRERGVNSTIELVATRSFELDLKLENFNGEGLTPAQIREQLGDSK